MRRWPRAFLEAMRPAQLEVSMAAIDQIAQQARRVDRQWELIVERARYEAELARRRFLAIDPENRLVGRTLERDWEAKLAEVERLERESATRPSASIRLVDPGERARILALAQDLPAVWQAATTTNVDRKQLLGFLIKDVCLTRAETTIEVSIRWQTEACTVLSIPRPRRSCDARRTDPVVLARLRALAADTPDGGSPRSSIRRGSARGPGSGSRQNIVKQLRYSYSIASGCPDRPAACADGYRADGRCTAKAAAELLNVNGIDHRGLVPVGHPGRDPIGVPRPLVDPVDAGDHRPLAQANPSLLVAAFGLMTETRPRDGPDFLHSIPNPVAKRCSMNDRSGCPAAFACHPLWGCTRADRPGLIRLVSEFFRQFVQPPVASQLLDVVEALAVDPGHAAISQAADKGPLQDVSAVHLVVQGVKPVVRRVLRFGVQRRLQLPNLHWRW